MTFCDLNVSSFMMLIVWGELFLFDQNQLAKYV